MGSKRTSDNYYGIRPDISLKCNTSRLDKVELWHQRLCHLNFKDLLRASKQELILSRPKRLSTTLFSLFQRETLLLLSRVRNLHLLCEVFPSPLVATSGRSDGFLSLPPPFPFISPSCFSFFPLLSFSLPPNTSFAAQLLPMSCSSLSCCPSSIFHSSSLVGFQTCRGSWIWFFKDQICKSLPAPPPHAPFHHAPMPRSIPPVTPLSP